MRKEDGKKMRTLRLSVLSGAILLLVAAVIYIYPTQVVLGAVNAVFVVNSSGDNPDLSPGDGFCDTGDNLLDGTTNECTLRAAIEEANALEGADTIIFAIDSGNDPVLGCDVDLGTCRIELLGNLPVIIETVLIDGSTQGGLPIHLIGTSLGLDGFVVDVGADGSEIRGFIFSQFIEDATDPNDPLGGRAIILRSDQNTVAGNFISGYIYADDTLAGSVTVGILVDGGANNVITGTNIISDTGTVSPPTVGNGIQLVNAASGTVITNNRLVRNAYGINNSGFGSLTIKGNTLEENAQAITHVGVGSDLVAYANNISGSTIGLVAGGSVSSTNARHNWWGDAFSLPTGVTGTNASARLGAPVVSWNDGTGNTTLGGAALSGGTGTAVIVSHGRVSGGPFGNATFSDLCSDYYDFFTVNGAGSWTVVVPVDGGCGVVLSNQALYYIPAGTNYATDCTLGNLVCWDLVPGASTVMQTLQISALSAAQLGGTQFVAGRAPDASDPTAIELVGFDAHRNGIPALWMVVVGLIIAALILGGLNFSRLRRVFVS